MNITYVLLSPTFGMHQYTADLANRVTDTGYWMPDTGYQESQLPASSFQPFGW